MFSKRVDAKTYLWRLKITKTLSINNVSIEIVVKTAKNGDEIVLEENGKPIAKITLIIESGQSDQKRRIAGLGKDTMRMSDDFDAELPLGII